MTTLYFKRGDDLDVSGIVEVRENKTDITNTLDFTDWEISCQIRTTPDQTGALVATVPLAFIGATSVFSGSVPSASTLTFPDPVYMDIRFRDENGKLRSSQTIVLVAGDAVSEVP